MGYKSKPLHATTTNPKRFDLIDWSDDGTTPKSERKDDTSNETDNTREDNKGNRPSPISNMPLVQPPETLPKVL